MTTLSNPFHVLGLTEEATPDDVRRAYRKLALRYHPDRNVGDPSARERFLAVKQAFDQLDTKDPDAGYDAERIVAQMEKAAEEAERRRSRRGEGGRGWQLIRVPLDQPQTERVREALTSVETLGGLAVAVGAAIGTGVSGYVPVWTAPLIGAGLATLAVWRGLHGVRNESWAVETHWQGLRDLRWDVTVDWSGIEDLRSGDHALDLVLEPSAARRLASVVPSTAFPEPAVYRLPTQEAARLAALIRPQLTA